MADAVDTINMDKNDSTKLQYGRQRIILNYDEVTEENFKDVFSDALTFFNANKKDCECLIRIFLGEHDILSRPAPNTSNINNKVVVNYAYPITREIVGYTFGNPFELIQKNTDKQGEVRKLADFLNYKDNYAIDISAALYASICGFGYQITVPSKDISKDNTPEVPLIVDTLDPRHTFVVQSTSIGNPQIMSCMEVVDAKGNTIKYVAFTNDKKFTYYPDEDEKLEIEDNPIGLDPITMIENSLLLTGDWEQAISVMNALNMLTSDSLNDVEGTIKALLVLLGTELDDPETTMKTIKEKRLLSLANGGQNNGGLDAKFISPKLDGAEVKEIRDFLDQARNIITGIPDRQTAVGGDTGAAVINRNGWTDIEIVARLKELFFKKAKRKQVAVALRILQNLDLISKNVKVMDIDITLGRNTLDNLSVKANAFSTLVATGELATIDALDFSGLTNRTNEVVARGEKAKEEREKKAIEMAQQNANLANGETDDDKKGTQHDPTGDSPKSINTDKK